MAATDAMLLVEANIELYLHIQSREVPTQLYNFPYPAEMSVMLRNV